MDFLPKDYKIPSTSNYMKFEEGENKFRVLGSAIVGTEYWTEKDGKRTPVRVKPGTNIPMDQVSIDPKFGKKSILHFWAFPVFNYQTSKIQILEIKQKSIMTAISGYVNNPKWGDPKEYDITITKTTEGGKVAYSVMPDPKEELNPEIKEAFMSTTINLEALFENGDPFVAPANEDVDPGEIEKGLEKLRKAVPGK
jgi:hypothetical protein